MIKLGITGRIGAGKTTVAGLLKKLGGIILSADDIGRNVVEKTPPILSKLIRTFGKDIVTPDGNLKRRDLGRIAFSSKENKQKLNSIVHPPLLKTLRIKIQEYEESNDYELLIIDAALLIDWNLQEELDYSICVVADREAQINRMQGKGLSRNEVESRLNSQIPENELIKACDFVIENNGTFEELETKVREIFNKIISLK